MGFRSDIPAGLELLSGGGTINTATVTAAVTAGYVGIYLDPRYVWTISSTLVINGVNNFTIESRMSGGMASGSANTFPTTPVYNTNGYISTSIATVTVASCVLNGTTTVTVASGGFPGVNVGSTVTGTDIPTTNGAMVYVQSIVGNTMTLNNAATGSGTFTLTFGSDGIQIFGPATGSTTTGITLRGLAIVGANPQASPVHVGGNASSLKIDFCFMYNTSSASNSYGHIIDTGLATTGPQEDALVSNCSIAGAWAAVGISVGDGPTPPNKCNDMEWFNLTTNSTGPYSIIAKEGGNHQFHQYYDRSEPTTATVWNQGAVLIFYGGEDLNAGTGLAHLVAGGATTLVDRTVSGSSTTISVTGGTLIHQGRGQYNGSSTMTISGGVVDMSAIEWNFSNCTITGSAGTLYQYPRNGQNGLPTVTGFTGQLLGTPLAITSVGNGVSATRSPAFTPPASANTVRVSVYIHISAITTSLACTIAYTDPVGAVNVALPLVKGSLTTLAPQPMTATGIYWGTYLVRTDSSGAAITVTLTPTTATYSFNVTFEVLSIV